MGEAGRQALLPTLSAGNRELNYFVARFDIGDDFISAWALELDFLALDLIPFPPNVLNADRRRCALRRWFVEAMCIDANVVERRITHITDKKRFCRSRISGRKAKS